SNARGPGFPAPREENSRLRTAYARFAKTTVVTLRPSRAMVHNACAVYMALPSAVRHSTWRSGHATEAPTARGSAMPIDPPVLANQSWGGASLVAAIRPRPEVMDSSTTMNRSEEHTSELQSRGHLVCRFLL